jgi:hypothetical protein
MIKKYKNFLNFCTPERLNAFPLALRRGPLPRYPPISFCGRLFATTLLLRLRFFRWGHKCHRLVSQRRSTAAGGVVLHTPTTRAYQKNFSRFFCAFDTGVSSSSSSSSGGVVSWPDLPARRRGGDAHFGFPCCSGGGGGGGGADSSSLLLLRLESS